VFHRFTHHWFHQPIVFYETPDVTQSAAQGSPVANGTPPAGQGQSQGGTGLDWGMFPNVPEEHRPLLEPTIREQIQPYITRLEQQYAPFKAFEGVNPQDAQGLLQMAQDFERDPVDVWLRMGQALNQTGQHLQDIDFEFLKELAEGRVPMEEDGQGGGDGQLPPELAQFLQPLQQQVQGLTQWQQQEAQREQERQRQQVVERQNQAYQTAASQVKTQLQQSGWPEELLTDQALRAAIIAGNGSVQGAVKSFSDLRSGLLKGFVDTKQPSNRQSTQNGNPPAPKQRTRQGGSRNDGFESARDGAEQFLKRSAAAAQQG
jgi:hypothetical protein